MAKLCSPFGTSPVTSFFSELTPNAFPDEFHQIQPDPFDFLEDLPSICGDIQKIESDEFTQSYSDMDLDFDMKPEIRNTDLMWWTAPPPSLLSSSASSRSSDIGTSAPLATVMGAAHPEETHVKQENSAPSIIVAKKMDAKSFKNDATTVKQEPTDDVEQQLQYNSIPNNKSTVLPALPPLISDIGTAAPTSMQNIPPGTSLLRKSQQLQQKKTQQQMRGAVVTTKRGDQLLPSANSFSATADKSPLFLPNSTFVYQRPDTPHSLDDDSSTPEFRHNVDLRACIMGSNNISLTTDQDFIKNVTEELQDTSKRQIDTRLAVGGCSLTDVLEVINGSPNSPSLFDLKNTTSALTPSTTCSSGFSFHSANKSGSMRSSESDSDEESMPSSSCSLADHDITYNTGGVSPVSSQTSNIGSSQHYMQHRDHSYTRYKDDLSTNLETPSDSEEEIDVVSINDKKLPTNPSDKDRRVLQTKVAHKFNASRIVKTPSGIRTIPPRRGSYEYPYTPASSSPVKSVNNSRFPSPAVTPFQNQYTTKYVQQQQLMTVVVGDTPTGGSNTMPVNVFRSSNDKSRKRLLANNVAVIAPTTVSNHNDNNIANFNKKHRGKKTNNKLVAAVHLLNGLKRRYSVDETADTIEKRNLHNDMERQRRIGLKNLFEALKKQIPSIKDKERAPKVNILREAAKLCEALTREDQQLLEQKAKLKEELRRKQELLAKLKAAQQFD